MVWALTTLEVLCPLPCGFDKNFQTKNVHFIGSSCLDGHCTLVELVSSPLYLNLILSIFTAVSFRFCLATMLVYVMVFWTPCSHDVSSLSIGYTLIF